MAVIRGCRVCGGVDPKTCLMCRGKTLFDPTLEAKYARLKEAVYRFGAALDTTEIGVIDTAYKNLMGTVRRGEG